MENYKIVLDNSDSIKIVVSRQFNSETKGRGTAIIRINESNYDMLSRYSKLSGVPIGKLASACIDYVFKNEKIVLVEV